MLTVGSLFSGIGGLDLGLERAGMRVEWHCEIEPWCRAVLAHHWPGVPCYDDVRSIDGTAPRVDLIAGGFPCQPNSGAGKRLGTADERWLWPEFERCLRLLRPRYALVENVPGLLTVNGGAAFSGILGSLATLGYDAEWFCSSAAEAGAPHKRDRLWVVAILADTSGGRLGGRGQSEPTRVEGARGVEPDRQGERGSAPTLPHAAGERGGASRAHPDAEGRADARLDRADQPAILADADSAGREERRRAQPDGTQHATFERSCEGLADPEILAQRSGLCEGEQATERWRRSRHERGTGGWYWATEPDVGRVAYGVPARVDRLRGLGNAVVPQVAEAIGTYIINRELRRIFT